MFEYFNIDLTADDGLKNYGGDRVRIGLITCEEYRLLDVYKRQICGCQIRLADRAPRIDLPAITEQHDADAEETEGGEDED